MAAFCDSRLTIFLPANGCRWFQLYCGRADCPTSRLKCAQFLLRSQAVRRIVLNVGGSLRRAFMNGCVGEEVVGTYRMYTDSDGHAKWEAIDLATTPEWMKGLDTTKIAFGSRPPGVMQDWHPAPQRQF